MKIDTELLSTILVFMFENKKNISILLIFKHKNINYFNLVSKLLILIFLNLEKLILELKLSRQ